MKALLPALNSPAMTSRNGSCSACVDQAQRLVILRRGLEGAQAVAKLLREPPLLREKIHLATAQDGGGE